jgi:membrane-associated phospholipid phosphatase
MTILLFGLVSVTRTFAAPVLSAQSADTTVARAPLFTRNDAYLGAAFVAGTIALRPLDRSIARRLQNPNTQTNRTLQNLATDVRLIASPGSLIIGGSLYAVGRLGHHDRLADLGLHGLEAIIVGSVLNTGVKWTAGRARPYVIGDSNPNDYVFLRGLRKGNDYQSFPSGHSVAAFAAAAVVTSEASRWYPRTKWYIGTAMYAGAAAVALSRLYNDQHWASDVIVGAGIGTFAGNKVVRFNHSTELGNRIDRWLLPTSVVPDARGGVSLGWTVAPGFGSQ